MATPDIEVRRVYDDPKGKKSEYRVLVDRLWPRRMARQSLRIDAWAKDIAPSADLRSWYGHDPDRFAEFSRRYRAELWRRPTAEALTALLRVTRGKSALVLLTATKDVERSGAAVLVQHLRRRRVASGRRAGVP